jgi:hypothetical protein
VAGVGGAGSAAVAGATARATMVAHAGAKVLAKGTAA